MGQQVYTPELISELAQKIKPSAECQAGIDYGYACGRYDEQKAQTEASSRYRLLSDNDGHHYLVPAEKENEFNTWVDSFDDENEGDPDGYEKLGAVSLGCSPTCVTFTDPLIS